jgi:hypothetical protein
MVIDFLWAANPPEKYVNTHQRAPAVRQRTQGSDNRSGIVPLLV